MSDQLKINQIVITKNKTKIIMQRSDVMEIKHSHDGLVFNLLNGLHIYASDSFMTIEMKEKIVSAFDRFKNADITIDLGNYNSPVSINVK